MTKMEYDFDSLKLEEQEQVLCDVKEEIIKKAKNYYGIKDIKDIWQLDVFTDNLKNRNFEFETISYAGWYTPDKEEVTLAEDHIFLGSADEHILWLLDEHARKRYGNISFIEFNMLEELRIFLHETAHHIQFSEIKAKNLLSVWEYFIKLGIDISAYNPKLYKKKHDEFPEEIDADIFAYQALHEIFDKKGITKYDKWVKDGMMKSRLRKSCFNLDMFIEKALKHGILNENFYNSEDFLKPVLNSTGGDKFLGSLFVTSKPIFELIDKDNLDKEEEDFIKDSLEERISCIDNTIKELNDCFVDEKTIDYPTFRIFLDKLNGYKEEKVLMLEKMERLERKDKNR